MTPYRSAGIAGALAAAALLAACATVERDDAADAVASARTTEEHQQVAAFFDARVRRYEREAAQHAALAQGYTQYADRVKVGAAEHCRGLEGKFNDSADEARSTAALHRDLAAKAR